MLFSLKTVRKKQSRLSKKNSNFANLKNVFHGAAIFHFEHQVVFCGFYTVTMGKTENIWLVPNCFHNL